MSYVFFAFVFFLAGVVPELTGFGVATISMPLLSLVMPLSLAIPLVAVLSMCATGFVAWQSRRRLNYRRIAALVVGSAIGVPLGMAFLDIVSEQVLALVFGVFLIIYALYGMLARGHFLPHTKAVGGVVGVLAGFLGASFNIHGPLVGLYSADDERNSKVDVTGLTAAYMFISGVFTVAGHLFYGRITPEVLYGVLFSLPFLFAGLALGTRFARRMDATWIRHIVYVFVLVVGVSLLVM